MILKPKEKEINEDELIEHIYRKLLKNTYNAESITFTIEECILLRKIVANFTIEEYARKTINKNK